MPRAVLTLAYAELARAVRAAEISLLGRSLMRRDAAPMRRRQMRRISADDDIDIIAFHRRYL